MPDDEKKEKQNRPGSTSLLTKYRKHRDAVKKIAASSRKRNRGK